MTISEYKERFADLFTELQAEHGAVDCVHIENEDCVRVEGFTSPIGSRVDVSIDF